MAIKTLKNTVKTTENLIADAVDIQRQKRKPSVTKIPQNMVTDILMKLMKI